MNHLKIGLVAFFIVAAGGAAIATQMPQVRSQGIVSPLTSTQVQDQAAQSALLEEVGSDGAPRRYAGSVAWQTERLTGAGNVTGVAVKANVEIPERKLSLSWLLARNTDNKLPASHTIEIRFKVPPDFASGGISDIPGVLMTTPGNTNPAAPLAALSVKVRDGFFLIGLSGKEKDVAENIVLLKDESRIDIAMVYADSRRAILSFEKGPAGVKAFKQGFAAWEASR